MGHNSTILAKVQNTTEVTNLKCDSQGRLILDATTFARTKNDIVTKLQDKIKKLENTIENLKKAEGANGK